MPSYIKRASGRWRAEVYVGGVRESATRPTKAEAVAWATQREAELTGKRLPEHTVREVLQRYALECSPLHKGNAWEQKRILRMLKLPIAAVRLAVIAQQDLAQWRDMRLKKVQPGSVKREYVILRSALRQARIEWGWLRQDPCEGLKMPPAPPSRKRRVTEDEIALVSAQLGVADGLHCATAIQRTGLAFLFAIETAMRAGEICGLRWADVGPKTVMLARTKNGDRREVPLSPRARQIIAALPRAGEFVFALNNGSRDQYFREAVKAAGVANLHFHDSRAEAIWRLSKKFPVVMDLARVIGHRDVNSLMIYYNTSAADLADLL